MTPTPPSGRTKEPFEFACEYLVNKLSKTYPKAIMVSHDKYFIDEVLHDRYSYRSEKVNL